MPRDLIRKTSFKKMVAAYRSQWKRTLLRIFIPGYGKKGVGWLSNPKKACYNFWYNRTSLSIPRMLGYKPSFGAYMFAMTFASLLNVFSFPVDATKSAVKAHRINKLRKTRSTGG